MIPSLGGNPDGYFVESNIGVQLSQKAHPFFWQFFLCRGDATTSSTVKAWETYFPECLNSVSKDFYLQLQVSQPSSETVNYACCEDKHFLTIIIIKRLALSVGVLATPKCDSY